MNRRVRGKEETQVKISIRDFGWEEARLSWLSGGLRITLPIQSSWCYSYHIPCLIMQTPSLEREIVLVPPCYPPAVLQLIVSCFFSNLENWDQCTFSTADAGRIWVALHVSRVPSLGACDQQYHTGYGSSTCWAMSSVWMWSVSRPNGTP
jgi:hypothetical protein